MLHNKFLAGKTATVDDSIHKSLQIEFDENGNLKTELTKTAEDILLSLSGFEKGKNETPIVVEKKEEANVTSDEVKILKAKLAKRDEDLKHLEASLEETKTALELEVQKVAGLEEQTVTLTATVTELEAELAKPKKK